MRSVILYFFAGWLALSCQAAKRVVVHDAAEFFEALGSNRVVVVAEGVTIHLDDWTSTCPPSESSRSFYLQKSENLPTAEGADQIINSPAYQGREAVLRYLKDLSIEGERNSAISTSTQYAAALKFLWCKNIAIRNLTIKREQSTTSDAGLIEFHDCYNVKVGGCTIDGNGSCGLTAKNVQSLKCLSNVFTHESKPILLENATGSLIRRCDFVFNRNDIEIDSSSKDTRFEQCRFSQNPTYWLFYPQSHTKLVDCLINIEKELTGEHYTDWLHPTGYTKITAQSVPLAPLHGVGAR